MSQYEKQWSSATPGLLIILMDQSGSMLSDYEDGDSKTVFAAKAVNHVIDVIIQKNFDGESPKNRAFISVIGYNHEVHELSSGFLKDLDSNPLRIDKIKAKQSNGAGGLVEVEKSMPVWVDPITHDGATNMKGAFEMAKALIERWIADKPDSPAPVIVNISDGEPYYEGKNPLQCMKETLEVVKSIKDISVADGNVLVFNVLIRKSGQNISYPVSRSECPGPEAECIFDISSEIPEAYKGIARAKEIQVKDGSMGCIFEANGVQLISLIDFGSSKAQLDI